MKDHAPSMFAVLGSLLAVDEASLRDRVVWIGAQLSVEDFGISVAIPKDKLDAMHGQTTRFLSATDAQKKDLRSFCGKLSFVAGMVQLQIAVGTRPLSTLPGALVVAGSPLRGSCPCGFGGVLFERFKAVAWYTAPITKNDLRKFRASIGASKHNTTWLWGSDCQGRGSWRASGLIHCKRSGARCCSPASPPTSTLLPGSWPWTPSWASAQWSSRLTSGVLPDDLSRMWTLSRTVYRSLLSACDGSRLPVLEDRHCIAQDRNTGKKAHTAWAQKHREFRAPYSWSHSPCGRMRTACHPGTRGFTACLCAQVKSHHTPSPWPPAHAALVPASADGTTMAAYR